MALALVLAGCSAPKPEATGAGPRVAVETPAPKSDPVIETPTPTPTEPTAPSKPPVKPEAPSKPSQNPKDEGHVLKRPKNQMVQKFESAIGKFQEPKNGMQIQPARTGQWGPSQSTPEQVAAKVEETLARQTKVSGILASLIQVADGRGGGEGKIRVKDPKTFRVDFMTPKEGNQGGVALHKMVVKDGKLSVSSVNGKIEIAKPDHAVASLGAGSTQEWATLFGRDIFTSIGGGKPLTNLVKMARKPNSGFVVSAEQQSFIARGTTIVQERILVTRTPELEKKLGKLSIEVISDGRLHLPVTVRSAIEPPKKAPTRMYWTMRWNLKTGQVFEKEDFSVPHEKIASKVPKTTKA